jgi:hypothetical protein
VSCFRVAVFLGLIVLSSCKDYHKDMLEWANELPTNSSREQVKVLAPDYLVIDWENPEQVNSYIYRYEITKIRGHEDPVQIKFYLEFENSTFLKHGWERLE